MKVVCAGCQAKYQIPDERVAGRKLKIRCRKCGEAIIVRGDQAAQPASAQMGYPPPPTADEWHVSLEGDQHGPYPSAQMATMLRNGQLASVAPAPAAGTPTRTQLQSGRRRSRDRHA